jgi:hypothetical protein
MCEVEIMPKIDIGNYLRHCYDDALGGVKIDVTEKRLSGVGD